MRHISLFLGKITNNYRNYQNILYKKRKISLIFTFCYSNKRHIYLLNVDAEAKKLLCEIVEICQDDQCYDDKEYCRTDDASYKLLHQGYSHDECHKAEDKKSDIFHCFYLNIFLKFTGIGVVNSIGSLVAGW